MAKSGIANRTEKRRSNATTASMASPAFHSPNASQNDPKIPSSTSAASDDEEFFIAAERQLVAEAIASPSKKEVTGTKRRNLKKYSKKRAGKELNPEDRAQKKRDTKADGMQVFTSEDNAENEDENDLNETNNDEEDEIDLDENDVPIEKWTVQEFRGSKIDKEGEIYMQVKWEGHKDLTWEPEFNLKLDVPGRLAEYYESHGGRLKVLRNLLDIQTQGKKVTNKMKKGGKGKR